MEGGERKVKSNAAAGGATSEISVDGGDVDAVEVDTSVASDFACGVAGAIDICECSLSLLHRRPLAHSF